MTEWGAGTIPIARGLGAADQIRWPLVPSGKLFELRYGKALTEGKRRPGAIPVFGSNGPTGMHDTPLFKGPGVILGRKGMGHLGVKWTDHDFWVIDTAYSLKVLGGVNLKFSYYLISHVGLDHLKHGTSNPSLTREAFAAQLFPIPPEDTQRAIAEVLGALDDKIAANDKARQVAGALARARFEKAAKFGIRNTIRDVATLVTRGITPKYTDSDGVTILNQKCIRDQWVGLDVAKINDSEKTRPNKMLHRNDVLVNSTGFGTLGRTARWVREMEATVDSHISIVRFDPNSIDPVCAGYGLLRMEDQIESLAEGSTGQTELRRDLLASLEILVPRREDQPALGRELTELDSHALALEDESRRLTSARDELLPLLMSGNIRVRDAERTVEEVA